VGTDDRDGLDEAVSAAVRGEEAPGDDERDTAMSPDPDALKEAAALRRDRERADRQAAKEAERARRDEEKAQRQREKDAEKARKDTERLDRERRRVEEEAAKQAERDRQERERHAREAAREAGRAQREAEAAERAAALARQRAEREAARARRQAERAEGAAEAEDDVADLADLPPDLAVLWRRPAAARRGPRPGLTLEQIADAAIALADAEGLDAVSMARLAESLGFTTMSLYRYVSSKDEVLMLMSDRAAGRPPEVGPEVGDWRARLELLLGLMRPVLAAHPWMSRTTSVLFAVGPNRLAWMEAMAAALEDLPLREHEKLQAVGALSSHQLEWARLVEAETARRRALAESGGGEPQDPNAVIGRLITAQSHPAIARAVAAGVFDEPDGSPDADDLDLGTRLLLDGLAALVERRR